MNHIQTLIFFNKLKCRKNLQMPTITFKFEIYKMSSFNKKIRIYPHRFSSW